MLLKNADPTDVVLHARDCWVFLSNRDRCWAVAVERDRLVQNTLQCYPKEPDAAAELPTRQRAESKSSTSSDHAAGGFARWPCRSLLLPDDRATFLVISRSDQPGLLCVRFDAKESNQSQLPCLPHADRHCQNSHRLFSVDGCASFGDLCSASGHVILWSMAPWAPWENVENDLNWYLDEVAVSSQPTSTCPLSESQNSIMMLGLPLITKASHPLPTTDSAGVSPNVSAGHSPPDCMN